MSFDRLARHYAWMEWVLAGAKLQRCRLAFLDSAAGAKRILLAGEGHGRFLLACRRRAPHTPITCLDASAAMLAQAKARLSPDGPAPAGVDFVHADLLDWAAPAGAFDLIVTHFFLDCFPPQQLAQAVGKLARAATPAAAWLLADFQIPASGPGRYRAQLIHRLMYAFFVRAARLPARRLTPPDPWLRKHGFSLARRQQSEWGLLHSDRWLRAACHG